MSKIVLIRQKYTASGGAERFVSRAMSALQQHQQLDVHLIARKWEKVDGISAHILNPFYLGNLWRDISFARAARTFWQQHDFDLIQSHERIVGTEVYRAGDGVHAHWLRLRAQSRGIMGQLSQFLNPYHHYVKHTEKKMFLHPDLKKVICNSRMIKKEIQQYFGLPDEKFSVIYNGVDQQQFSPELKKHRHSLRTQLGIQETTPVLLYVGSGFERKGVARALHAITPYPDIALIIVGRDKHSARYEQLAQTLGVTDRCFFVGAQKEISAYLGAADGFILPTLYDPFPNACIEALASGLAVITSATCGVSELIDEGKNGFVADALQLSSWQNAVGKWLSSFEQNPQQLSTAARNSVAHLTLANMSAQMLELYQNLLDKQNDDRH